MSDIDPNKLKVVELRAELSNRGLDTKGNKAVLVKRLQTALNQARGTFTSEGDDNISDDQSGLDSQDSMAEDSFVQEDKSDVQEKDEDAEKEKCPDEEEEVEKPVIDEERTSEEKTDDKMETADSEEVNGAREAVTIKEEPAEDSDVKREQENSEEIQIKEESSEEQRNVKTEESPNAETGLNEQHKAEKRRRSRSPPSEHKTRSRSPSGERKRSRSKTPPKQEEEESFDETLMTLDTYNSDLNLIIDKSRYIASPLTDDGFAFVWAGARATHGFRKGKICFEVKIVKEMDVSHLPSDEPNPHVVRVGVSTEDTSMQLGEEPQSYGYGGTGKASTNCQFKDYGSQFGAGDVIACFLNLDSEPMQISFSKNGNFQGIAYTIPHEQIGEKALFPHVLSKNCSFEVNFGQRETPYFPIPEAFSDYVFSGCVPAEDRVRGRKPLSKREDCEMIMMCGLPGSGKSTWAANYCALHPDKCYNVLGTNNIIDKMKVMGLPRKRNYAGRWDVLIEKSTKCLNKLLEMSSRVKRNFILDQTNVYASAQRRKMRPFEGFKRRAVVLVPTDEEFRRRIAKREKEEGKDVPESAVLEMKANFILPEVGPIFDSVEYVELPESEARPLVDSYRREGRAAMPPPEKRFKPNERNIPQRGGGRFGPPMPNRDRDSRNRNDDRRYNPPNRGGYTPGGRGMNNSYPSYRDNRHQDRSGYNRGNRGPMGPNRPGMNRGGPPNRSGPPMSGGRGPPPPPPPHSSRSNYSSYNSRDRSYQSQSAKSDHKSSGQNQGYGQSGYGNSNYNQNYNYQTYSYGQPNYGQQQGYGQQQQPPQQQQQWKQSSNNYGSQNYATYSQPSYSQPQQQTSTYSQQQVQQQTQPTTTAAQSYYNQQYYNQQWSQWNQQNQQYYNQYYPYYNQGYASYGQQNSQPK